MVIRRKIWGTLEISGSLKLNGNLDLNSNTILNPPAAKITGLDADKVDGDDNTAFLKSPLTDNLDFAGYKAVNIESLQAPAANAIYIRNNAGAARIELSNLSTMAATQGIPSTSDNAAWGTPTKYWGDIYGNRIRYKTCQAFEQFDDIALIKAIRPDLKNPNILDNKTFSERIRVDKLIDIGGVIGLLIGTVQKIISHLEL